MSETEGFAPPPPGLLGTLSFKAATRFLRAGGVVSLGDWKGLLDTEKDALEAAGEIVAVERAHRVAQAFASLVEPVSSPVTPSVEDAMEAAGQAALRAVGK